MSIIIFIIILGLLIFVHELGHFSVAKKSGIRVDEFAVGFPPRIFSFVKNGTRYALNLIPFGGYVKIFGETPDEESLASEATDSFVNKPRTTQAAVLIAGVLFNVIFAWILLSIAFMIGFDVPKEQFSFLPGERDVVVEALVVSEDSPAEKAGLERGDSIYLIEKGDARFEINSADEGVSLIKNTETPFSVYVNRGEEDLSFTIDSKMDLDGTPVVGIYLEDIVNTKSSFFASIRNGFLMTGFAIKEVSVALWDLLIGAFTGTADLNGVAGPVGIVGLVDEAAQVGIVSLITFTAFISINLAVLNLAPFPALDGGRLAIILIESIIRRDLNHKIVNIVNLIGFLILIGLMVLITISDVEKLF